MPQSEFRLEWDPQKAATNARKHGVRFERAAIVFCDPEALSLYDGAHSQTEDRWITLGMDAEGATAGSLSHLARDGRRRGRVPCYFRPQSHQNRSAAISTQMSMKREYDFSKGQRGKFYRLGAKLNLPVYLEPEVQARLTKAAQKRREDVSALVNRLLKHEIETAEALR